MALKSTKRGRDRGGRSGEAGRNVRSSNTPAPTQHNTNTELSYIQPAAKEHIIPLWPPSRDEKRGDVQVKTKVYKERLLPRHKLGGILPGRPTSIISRALTASKRFPFAYENAVFSHLHHSEKIQARTENLIAGACPRFCSEVGYPVSSPSLSLYLLLLLLPID